MASYNTVTLSFNPAEITSNDCPYMVDNLVYLRVTLTANSVIRLSSNLNYCIITSIFSPTTTSRVLTILPAAGTTINGAGSTTMTYNGEGIAIVREIGRNNFITLGYKIGSGIPTIGTSTNNAIVRVGSSPNTVANSTTLIDDSGNLLTANNITATDTRNNGFYFYAQNTKGLSMGTSLSTMNTATAIGINAVPVSSVTGIFLGFNVIKPTATATVLNTTYAIGSQAVPNATGAISFQNNLFCGYNCWQPTVALNNTIGIGNNLFTSSGATAGSLPVFIGQNLFNDVTTTIETSTAIGRGFTGFARGSLLVGSNIVANMVSNATTGLTIFGHNSSTLATSTKKSLTVFGSNCNVLLTASIIFGYGINAQGPNTTVASIIGATACSAATSLTSTSTTVMGYGSSPNISGNDIVAIGSGSNGLGTTSIFTAGYQAAASSTITASACLGFQSCQTGTCTNTAAIGYQTFNASATAGAAIGSKAFIQTTGANNVGAGYNIGSTLTTGTDNFLFGSGANVNAAARTQAIVFGAGAQAQGDGEFVLGSAGTALTTQTTIGAAGTANVLPATPQTYLFVRLNGTLLRTPLYN